MKYSPGDSGFQARLVAGRRLEGADEKLEDPDDLVRDRVADALHEPPGRSHEGTRVLRRVHDPARDREDTERPARDAGEDKI